MDTIKLNVNSNHADLTNLLDQFNSKFAELSTIAGQITAFQLTYDVSSEATASQTESDTTGTSSTDTESTQTAQSESDQAAE